jgi:hypothetical protein
MSSGYRWMDALQLWRVATNTLNKQPRTNDKGWFPTFGVKNMHVMNSLQELLTWTASLDKWHKQRNMDMKFGTQNVRSLYKAGLLETVSKELSKL